MYKSSIAEAVAVYLSLVEVADDFVVEPLFELSLFEAAGMLGAP